MILPALRAMAHTAVEQGFIGSPSENIPSRSNKEINSMWALSAV